VTSARDDARVVMSRLARARSRRPLA